jgi:hypothetical protein
LAQFPAESFPNVAPVRMLFSNCAPRTSAPSKDLQGTEHPAQQQQQPMHTHISKQETPC